MIYYFLPLYSFCLAIFSFKKTVPRQLFFLLILLFLLLVLLIAGGRGEGIGSDYFSYYYLFRDGEDIELGFLFLIKITKIIGGDFSLFILMIFFWSFFLKCYVFKKLSPYPLISLMIYFGFWFLVYDMNGIRQGLALSMTGLATYFLWKKQLIGYWICCVCAFLFHYSSIVFLPFIFIVRKKCTLKLILLTLGGAFLFAFQGGLTNIISLFWGSDSYFISKIFSYGVNDNYNGNILFSFSTFHRLLIFIMLYVSIPKMEIEDRLKQLFLWAAIVNVVFYLLFTDIEIIATRLSLYYRFVECFSLAAIPTVFYRYYNRLLVLQMLCIYVLWQVYSTLSIPDNSLVPYYMNL